MGSGHFNHDTWKGYADSKNYAQSTAEEIYTQRHMAPELDPHGVSVRESRDSVDNPASTPLIVALDVTGSMQEVLGEMARQGLPRLMTEVYNRKPIHDPHVMAMGIGDAEAGDQAPLQITQFEADIRIAEQLEKIYLEKRGGGNHYESYILAWYFAAYHTAIDSFEKRGKKGFLFTVGDEEPTPKLRVGDVKRVMGGTVPTGRDLSAAGLLAEVSKQWEVYHVIVAEGSEARSHPDTVRAKWTALLGQHVIWMEKHAKLGEIIVSALQLASGVDYDEMAASWDAPTAAVVTNALKRGINLNAWTS